MFVVAHRVPGGNIVAADLEQRIHVVGTDGLLVHIPSKECSIESGSRLLIGGRKFGPAERARPVLFKMWHLPNITLIDIVRRMKHHAPADAIIEQLGLIPHPERGYYRETYRAPASVMSGAHG